MTISVALCTYNGAKFLREQIESILNQTVHIPNEIIICDDQSTDDTLKILAEYNDSHPLLFKIHLNEKNIGSTKNFDKAISLCTGEYIFLSDQDDIWKLDKTQKIIAVFEENPKAEAVFTNAELIDHNSQVINNITIWDSVFFLEKELPKPIDFFNLISQNGNVVTGATLCIKNSIKELILPFSKNELHDEKIATLIGLRETLYYIPENLIAYRLHKNQQIGMKNSTKIDKKKRLKRIILDLETPVTFYEYWQLGKKKYLKFKNAVKVFEIDFVKEQHPLLSKKSLQDYMDFKLKIKKKFPVKYCLFSIIDTLIGKRKI